MADYGFLDALFDKGKMTDQKASFCEHWVETKNRELAVIRAGYSEKEARRVAHRLLRDPGCVEYIKQLQEVKNRMMAVNAMDVLDEAIKIGFSNIGDFLDEDDQFVNLKALPKSALAAISSYKRTETPQKKGKPIVKKEIRLHDKNKAQELIMRHLGALKDIVEHRHSFTDESQALAAMNDLDQQISAIKSKMINDSDKPKTH